MKKLIALIKKLLGQSSSPDSSGFTLIELLVVIGILGILAAVLIVLIDPGDKIKSANDSKVLNDVREIYGANQRYMALNNAALGTTATLVSSGELKLYPVPPTGYATPYTFVNNLAVSPTDIIVGGEIQSKSSKSKTVGGAGGNMIGNTAACAATNTCYFVITGNKSCYKLTSAPAVGEACP